MSLYDAKGRPKLALPENAAQESDGNLDKIAEATEHTQTDLLRRILTELRVHTFILKSEFGDSTWDLDALRAECDPSKE